MLLSTMSDEEIFDEADWDIIEILYEVYESNRTGRINKLRSNILKKSSRKKRREFYKTITFKQKTERHNLWHCIAHVYPKMVLWQGYTIIKGSSGISTVFCEFDNLFLIDSHFFKRYRERYLDKIGRKVTSSLNSFNNEHNVFVILPQLFGDMETSYIKVLTSNGIALGEKVEYTSTVEESIDHKHLPASNFFILKTFLGFDDLKKTQIEELLEYLIEFTLFDFTSKKSEMDVFSRKRFELHKAQMEKMAILLDNKTNEYS